VASPGTSNHGYGLAADIAILSGSQTQSLASSTNVYNWMQDNAPQFGWTWETFPTAPGFEPWHLRHITGDTVTPRVIRVEEWVAAHTPA
jgi:LAS superfamily LD-carboxypeptidase LdcB